MPRRKEGARVLGPYGCRVVFIDESGYRTSETYESEGRAKQIAERLRAELAEGDSKTVGEAIGEYELHLRAKGNKPRSIHETIHRLKRFFPNQDVILKHVSAKDCAARYKELVKSFAADTQQGILTHARTFTKWAVRERLLSQDPLVGIEVLGKKKKGKPQLRIDESRVWLTKALELASTRNGPVAAMTALLMGLRAGEVTKRLVRDVDANGTLLRVEDTKTEAGERYQPIPELLQPFYRRLTVERAGNEPLFGYHTYQWVRFWVRRICKLSGVPLVCAHAMRGLHGTLGTVGGFDRALSDLARQMGHADSRVTKDHYIAPGALEQARQNAALAVLLGNRSGIVPSVPTNNDPTGKN